jgi:hypothetical protein
VVGISRIEQLTVNSAQHGLNLSISRRRTAQPNNTHSEKPAADLRDRKCESAPDQGTTSTSIESAIGERARVRMLNPEFFKRAAGSRAFRGMRTTLPIELMENCEHKPGWVHRDPVIFQSIECRRARPIRFDAPHDHARHIPLRYDAARTPELSSTLQRPGAFLDVGTGVGGLAIEAARVWPALRVVGIDQWEPALALAPSLDCGVYVPLEIN